MKYGAISDMLKFLYSAGFESQYSRESLRPALGVVGPGKQSADFCKHEWADDFAEF